MAWEVEVSATARKQLKQLGKPVSNRILKFISERLTKLEDPRQIGARLQGTRGDYWKYRVGDYRLVCSIQDDRPVVMVLRVGHRKETYSR